MIGRQARKAAMAFRILALLFPFLLLEAGDAWARAGGARSSHGGGGHAGNFGFYLDIFQIFAGLCIIGGSVYAYLAIRAKSAATRQVIEIYAAADPAWNFQHLKSVVHDTFFKVQEGWMERNQDICRDCITNKLYRDHEYKIKRLISDGHKNILQDMELNDILIVQATHDSRITSNDRFCAFLKGKMVDYEIDLTTDEITDGDEDAKPFKELWIFERQGDAWLLDEIDPEVTLNEIDNIRRRFGG